MSPGQVVETGHILLHALHTVHTVYTHYNTLQQIFGDFADWSVDLGSGSFFEVADGAKAISRRHETAFRFFFFTSPYGC